jgi:uncharacterized protein (TIGR02145 family)
MKKFLTLLLGLALFYSCSTSNDGNGNSTNTVVPVAPSNLTGTVTSTTQINLSWIDNSTNETGFKIERKTGTGTYAVVGTTTSDVNTFNDTGLTPSATYTYRVYSNNAVGKSLTYSNELTLPDTTTSVTDIDGNVYQLVTICNQTWTKTNLNVSKYRNGDIIPQVTDAAQWVSITTGAWCYYANVNSNGVTYGKLYNWYAVNDPRGLAPAGYHIPTDAEWSIMINCLDPNANGGAITPNVAGGAMKEMGTTHWSIPNTNANNSSSFTGLPGGARSNDGSFGSIGSYCGWWSSSESNIANYVFGRYLYYSSGDCVKGYTNKIDGLTVRFVKD